ncbi:MAG: MBL fold metallo-hydrolase [Verrucomicrobiales bacterium]|jgi:glyoxylase-like metal-dependent hydrolase (beta-lactamase superfamily II)|nr:MBL fold metallo-hydrolase [Verrucomicrobiales bacterium]
MNQSPQIHRFTGGLATTNAYFLKLDAGWLAVDAPEGAADAVGENGVTVSALVLTHGHWDHIWDAADMVEKFGCPVYYHRDDELLCTKPEVMRSFGLPVELRPVRASRFLGQGDTLTVAPYTFTILHVPGHCPGSICLYEEQRGFLFGGDVLFAGGVGRWDLPGGNGALLISGIKEKLLTLPDDVIVYPGHGEATTIGEERRRNPYVR